MTGSVPMSGSKTGRLKLLGFILIAAAAAIGAWLISPVFRKTFLDEPLPPFGDAMDAMDQQEIEAFDRAVDALRGTGTERNEAMPLGPTVLAEGTMRPRAHDVSGRALIVATETVRFLRFEDLDTINGPDLRIYLSRDLSNDDVIDLGPIRATQGNVNYALPDGVDIGTYRYALIWCRAFRVLFSFAVLE